jgi:hypothetical protein
MPDHETQLKDFALVVAKVCLTIEHHNRFMLLTEYTDYKEMKKMLSEIFPKKEEYETRTIQE